MKALIEMPYDEPLSGEGSGLGTVWDEQPKSHAMLAPSQATCHRVATMHCLPIPDDAFAALKLPPARAEAELRREFAVFLVKEGLLEPAQARTVAGMERVPFDSLLAQRQVAWGGSPEGALEDMRAARAAMRPDRT